MLLTPRSRCNNNTCDVFPESPFIRMSTDDELYKDVLSLPSTDGSNPGFLFSCTLASLVQSLASNATAMAGLSWTKISLPSQLTATFSFHRKFVRCLSYSTSSDGVIFFDDGPNDLLPNVDASQSLIYTPFIINPVSTARTSVAGKKSAEYFIEVKSIKINEKMVPIDTTLLSIDRNVVGGTTMISTMTPYTMGSLPTTMTGYNS